MPKTLIVIAGPTAVGKTAVAMQVARHFNTQIISADSRQCYLELGIGAAKPTPAELSEIRHYFIDTHSVHDHVDAKVFANYADECAAKIFRNNDVAVIVGGTGLYMGGFLYGLDQIPHVPEEVRQHVISKYKELGIGWLQREVKYKDPAFYSTGEIQNPQRLMRALEVYMATGRSITGFRNQTPRSLPFKTICFFLNRPRPELYERINERVDEMVNQGLVSEAKTLYPYRHLNALQTVGYRELFDHFDGTATLEKALSLIKQNTRHYAKRQVTWFKRWPQFEVADPDADNLIQRICTAL